MKPCLAVSTVGTEHPEVFDRCYTSGSTTTETQVAALLSTSSFMDVRSLRMLAGESVYSFCNCLRAKWISISSASYVCLSTTTGKNVTYLSPVLDMHLWESRWQRKLLYFVYVTCLCFPIVNASSVVHAKKGSILGVVLWFHVTYYEVIKVYV